MCKNCFGSCLVSAIATWAFFALLLKLLNAANPGINAVFLMVLMSIAMITCPIMNPKILEKCSCKTKPKKKR